MIEVLNRHSRIAFQLSGGKDSVALLMHMRPYWGKMTVYHLDTGDEHPQTTHLINHLARLVPITIIRSDVQEVKDRHGLPSDLVPWANTAMAHSTNVGAFPLIQDRVSCCWRTIMAPMHQRMIDDGITLIIRGQKHCDEMKGSLRSGDIVDGIEFLYPLEDWTDDDCFAAFEYHGIPVPDYYLGKQIHSGDCLGCTAWTDTEDRGAHLRQYYPDRYPRFQRELLEIARAALISDVGLFAAAVDCGLDL